MGGAEDRKQQEVVVESPGASAVKVDEVEEALVTRATGILWTLCVQLGELVVLF